MRVNSVFTAFVFFAASLLAGPSSIFAANEGQADLDKALELNITAQSEGELAKVAELAEAAITKGLDKDGTEFANQLLGATYFRRADQLSDAIFLKQIPPSKRWPFIRKASLGFLEKAKKFDPKLPDTHLLIARLQAELPMGDLKEASDAVDEAVKLLKSKDDSKRLAQALVLRARMNEDDDAKFADFDAAVKADPNNVDARQARARLYQDKGENEKALEDLKAAVQLVKDDFASLVTLAEQMTNAKQYEDALKLCDRVIKTSPKETLGYTLRARVRVLKEDDKGALKDLNTALKMDGDDLLALLFRSDLYDRAGKKEEAKADLDKAVRLHPDVPTVILSKAQFSARMGNFAEAIRDVQLLLRSDPKNKDFRLQMAVLLQADKRPRRAIEVLTNLIEDDSKDADLYRQRGDALLSVNKHAEAIKDYEAALKIDPEDTGVLNNLAWVLATSETESIRDADRSIKLGIKACELTKYEKPHILSTLASGYAEKGDWETAMKWSSKAVELAEGEMKENLQKELDSYKMKKPWRKAQNVEENTKPLDAKPSTDLET